jgi:iron complex outermembrane receptor protein
VGRNLSTFSRDHFRDAQGLRLYQNTGNKNEASTFVKAAWEKGAWIVYADAQLRFARFRYEGTEPIGGISWTFLNPKLGARRTLTPALSVYASAGISSREPARNDLFQGEDDPQVVFDLRAVKPERLVNVELGGDLKRGLLSLHANLYAMEFRNEIAGHGEQSSWATRSAVTRRGASAAASRSMLRPLPRRDSASPSPRTSRGTACRAGRSSTTSTTLVATTRAARCASRGTPSRS